MALKLTAVLAVTVVTSNVKRPTFNGLKYINTEENDNNNQNGRHMKERKTSVQNDIDII